MCLVDVEQGAFAATHLGIELLKALDVGLSPLAVRLGEDLLGLLPGESELPQVLPDRRARGAGENVQQGKDLL
jgi:hypothetical protein